MCNIVKLVPQSIAGAYAKAGKVIEESSNSCILLDLSLVVVFTESLEAHSEAFASE